MSDQAYLGAMVRTLCPRCASAIGRPPTTSPRPPVFDQGPTSADTNTICRGLIALLVSLVSALASLLIELRNGMTVRSGRCGKSGRFRLHDARADTRRITCNGALFAVRPILQVPAVGATDTIGAVCQDVRPSASDAAPDLPQARSVGLTRFDHLPSRTLSHAKVASKQQTDKRSIIWRPDISFLCPPDLWARSYQLLAPEPPATTEGTLRILGEFAAFCGSSHTQAAPATQRSLSRTSLSVLAESVSIHKPASVHQRQLSQPIGEPLQSSCHQWSI